MTSCTVTYPSRGEQILGQALGPIHSHWMEDARRFLEPACESDADQWTRWAAVRYLADDCRQQLEWERGLVDELRPFLAPEHGARLAREGDRVSRLRLDLDRIGRRHGTAMEFAAGTRALLEQLGSWCADIEILAQHLTRAMLPPEGAMFLSHLEAVSELRW